MKNKLIVVSGGTKGIGKAIVEQFMTAGFDAIVCARSQADLEELAIIGKEKFPYQVLHIFQANLAERQELDAFATFVQNIGVADILVNNAGVFVPGEVHNEAEGTLEKMIHTNLYTAYHLTRAILPAMITQKSGYIVNICSVASQMAYPNGGSYSISKFALLGMSKALREELKLYNIKVTAVLPGATFTASWEGVNLPPARFMQPQDVAAMLWASYNLSDGAVVEEILMRPQLGDI